MMRDHYGIWIFLLLAMLVVLLGMMSLPGRFEITGKPMEAGTSSNEPECAPDYTLECSAYVYTDKEGKCKRAAHCPAGQNCIKQGSEWICMYEDNSVCDYCYRACQNLKDTCDANCGEFCSSEGG